MHFRYGLLNAFDQLETSNHPIPCQTRLPWPDGALHVRSPLDAVRAGQVHRVGGRVIQSPKLGPSQYWIRPDATGSATSRRRIFVVGGSAAFGYPYRYEVSLSAVLGTLLKGAGYETVNAGQPSWTSGQIVPVVRRIVDRYAPSGLVIFLGNNEWLHWTVLRRPRSSRFHLRVRRGLAHSYALAAVQYWSLGRRDSTKWQLRGFEPHREIAGAGYALEHPLERYTQFDSDRWLRTKQEYLATFESNLSEMVRYAAERGVRVIVLTTPFNYRLSPAWKHPQPEAFRREHGDVVRARIRDAARLVGEGRCDAALLAAQEALASDPLPPVLHYLKGQCLEGRKWYAEAEEAYAQCRENMIGNLGGVLSINERIAKVASAGGAELLDVRELFDDYQHASGGYFNADLVHDDCHPTPLGHRLIARALAPLFMGD